MACELLGAKLLAPYFGTSIYVWAAALALTLGGLMTGYFVGGRVSRKYPGRYDILYWVMVLAGLLLILMPFTSGIVMSATIDMSLELGALLSLLVFMVPPLVCMGMVSPLIINLLTTEVTSAGNSAGTVYAISTLGGILLTFLMGFYIIPEFGLTWPAIVSGAALLALPMISLFRNRQKASLGIPILVMAFAFLGTRSGEEFTDDYRVLYTSEGILGQIRVVDHPAYEFTEDNRIGRGLIVNNTLQTFVGLDHDMEYSIWSWSHYFPTAASIFPPGSKVLLLGLGGGTIVKQLNRLQFDIDVVEIDKRIRDVSIDYFNLDPATEVHIDDARHFVRQTDELYDIVIFDTFLSEAVPEHLLTVEGFEDVLKIMNPGGMIMINFYGFIEGPHGLAARSVLKTLQHMGLTTEILATPGSEGSRNLIFLAGSEEFDFTKADYAEPTLPRIENLYASMLDVQLIDVSDASVLSDRKPKLARQYARAAREWKKSYNAYYRRHFVVE